MPVDPHHKFVDQAHEATIDAGKPYGCHDHPPAEPGRMVEVPDGWTEDGRRRTKMIPWAFKLDVTCGHTNTGASLHRKSDPKCAGCRWQ